MVKRSRSEDFAFLCRSEHDADFARIEVVANKLRQKLGCCRGEFGWFDDDAVSSSQDSDKRAENGHDRKITRRDDANDAQRSVLDSSPRVRRQWSVRLGLQPALEVFSSRTQRAKSAKQLDSCLVMASMTVIIGHCLRDAILVFDQ